MKKKFRLFFALFVFIITISSHCGQIFGATAQPGSGGGAEAFMNTLLGKSLIVLIFFGAIALFLRFLYGPKGIYRDRNWDDLNSEIKKRDALKAGNKRLWRRLNDLREQLEPLMAKEGRAFGRYTGEFYSGDKEKDELCRLKYEHSNEVFHNAWSIIHGEEALQEPTVARVILLAALYHDIGRFEQISRYGDFDDAATLNHALLGAKLLGNPRFMPGETPEVRRAVRGAVLLHSRASLPPALHVGSDSTLALAARALRDADKLDIMRVMSGALRPGSESDPSISYFLPDEAERYSPEVAKAVLENKPVLTKTMRFRNDFRLRLCGWANLFEFGAARRIMARNGHMELMLSWLPQDGTMDEVRAMVREALPKS